MKNKYVSSLLLATSFCAATMAACGVYGAPEPDVNYADTSATEMPSQQTEIQNTENQNTENLGTEDSKLEEDSANKTDSADAEDDSEYNPKLQDDICVYGPPEDMVE